MKPSPTIHSPFSQADGHYPDLDFTQHEYTQIQELEPHLTFSPEVQEVVTPYISKNLLDSAVSWFAQELIQVIEKHGEDNVLITYNLDGANWFWWRLRAGLIHQAYPPDILQAKSIRVTTSTGFQSFKPELNQAKLKWLPTSDLTDKIVISLDDIGDSGYTQAAIKELALHDGARQVITVNLLEKILPPPKKKLHHPDYALLVSQHAFLIGGGLDSGTDRLEREQRFRNLNLIAVLEQATQSATESAGFEPASPLQVAAA